MLDAHGAQGDAHIHVAAKVHVADGSRVKAAFLRLELVDDLHGAQLRRTADRAGRECGTQDVHGCVMRGDFTDDTAHHVGDVGEPFDRHQFRHAYRARDADAAEVVACEVDEHGVLSTFLFVCTQISCETHILLVVRTALSRSRDGVGIDSTARHLDQHLRGCSDELNCAEIVVEHIGGRVDLPQTPIEEERRARDLGAEAEGGNGLKDVAGIDMLLDRFDCLQKFRRRRSVLRHKVNGG